jgi:hypothetical protein
LKDGEQFTVRIGNWENVDTHWGPQFLAKMFEEKGFKTSIDYLPKSLISSNYYNEEERDELEGSKSIYVLRAKL